MREGVDVLYSLCYGLLQHTHIGINTPLSLPPASLNRLEGQRLREVDQCAWMYYICTHSWHVLKRIQEDTRRTTLAQYDPRITHSGFNVIGQSLT